MNTEIFGLNGPGAGTYAVNNPMLNKGSRAEFLAFAATKEVPDAVKAGLESGKLKLADMMIYSIRLVDGKTIKMFQTQDTKEIGLRNIDRARLPKQQTLLVSGVQILAAWTQKTGTGTSAVKANDEGLAKMAKFYAIDTYFKQAALVGRNATSIVTIVNEDENIALTSTAGVVMIDEAFSPFSGLETGVFTFRSNRTDLISEMPLSVFKQNRGLMPYGYYKLDNPRLIQDDVEIEFELQLGEEVEADNDNEAVWVMLGLHGTGTIPA